jgi:hypothetical protein
LKLPYNAHQHQLKEVKVYYPYHPRAGETICVVGVRNHRGVRCYVAAKSDGRCELIPQWMTHPDFADISILPTPCIEVKALHNLRLLVDSAIVSLTDTGKSRRDNEDCTERVSTEVHLGRCNISNNTTRESKEND